MQGLGGAAIAMFQDGTTLTTGQAHLMTVFAGVAAISLAVIAIGVVLMGIGLIVAALFGSKLMARADALVHRVEAKTTPIVEKTNDLLTSLSPNIRTIGVNAEQISNTVRAKVDEIGVTVTEVNHTVKEANMRSRAQVARVDGIVSDAITTTQNITHSVQHGIRVPIRQVEGIFAAVKVGVETLVDRSGFRRRRPAPRPYDV